MDGFALQFRKTTPTESGFEPLCLIGPNGAGKSQLLQVVAEIFQSVFNACVPEQERRDGNPALQFLIEYEIGDPAPASKWVRITRRLENKHRAVLRIFTYEDGDWIEQPLGGEATLALLPERVVGYTSGDNETLSLPFLISRSGYADEVGKRALSDVEDKDGVPDTRLMLVDYATHLEVLVANLLLGDESVKKALLSDANLKTLHSFRCVIQLAPSSGPRVPTRKKTSHGRKGIQLTDELERYIDELRRCSTCHNFEEKNDTYTFDFWMNGAVSDAFKTFFGRAIDLYAALHKLAMLNDLAIPKSSRERFRRDTNARRFASRLPEPQDEDKVFRFERVTFNGKLEGTTVEYVSLSDGEHQLVQLLGMFSMFAFPNVLFLLDEPESHFNPQWRVRFLSRIEELPTLGGKRSEKTSDVATQECLLTTHAPFVPSDMPKDNVIIFDKIPEGIRTHRPNIETYGTTFDAILDECFGVRPPISELSRTEIEELMESDDPDRIRVGLRRLGDSVEKVFLQDHLSSLLSQKG